MAKREWTRNSIIELIDWYLRHKVKKPDDDFLIITEPSIKYLVDFNGGFTEPARLMRVSKNANSTTDEGVKINGKTIYEPNEYLNQFYFMMMVHFSTGTHTSGSYTYKGFTDSLYCSAWANMYEGGLGTGNMYHAWVIVNDDPIVRKLIFDDPNKTYDVFTYVDKVTRSTGQTAPHTIPTYSYNRVNLLSGNNLTMPGLMAWEDVLEQQSWFSSHSGLILSKEDLDTESVLSWANCAYMGLGQHTSVQEFKHSNFT